MSQIADLQVEHNQSAHRFEIRLGDALAQLQYRRHGSEIVFIHTEVPPQCEGMGAGGKLARAGLEYAKANGLAVVAECPFIAGYIGKHPEYAGLLKTGVRK